jgi:hypothetical protein
MKLVLTLSELEKLRHYDALKEQYVVERDLARAMAAHRKKGGFLCKPNRV